MRLERGPLTVDVELAPLSLTVRRAGRRVAGPIVVRVRDGAIEDQWIQWTEGVVAHEQLGDPVGVARAEKTPEGLRLELDDGTAATLCLRVGSDRVELALDAEQPPSSAERPVRRLALAWPGHPEQRFLGLGARHGTRADQSGRTVRLGADRRYTGPDCPPDMLDIGGIPQGDCAPMPFVLSSRGWAAWLDTEADGASFALGEEVELSTRAAGGPLRVHLFCAPSPAARLRDYLRAIDALPALLPEWAYGHWKSRDVYEHQRDVEADLERLPRAPPAARRDRARLAVGHAIQHVGVQPAPVPGRARRCSTRLRAHGVRTVVWVTPWVNLDSSDGQRPPDAESERLHREPASNYAEGAAHGHFVRGADGEPHVARWWMGTGSPVDFTSPAAEAWWREQAKRVLAMGVQGIKADDGEGFYYPDDVRFADGSTGAQGAWGMGLRYRRSMQRALDEVHPGDGALFARPGWTGHQGVGVHLGRRPGL